MGVKWVGREVNHSPPSSAEVENEWIYTSVPPVCLHVVDRDSFNFADDVTMSGRSDAGTM